MRITSRRTEYTIYWGLWVVLLVLFFSWPLTHLDAYAWSNDEGLYVQRAALANAGFPLYTETFFNKPPLLIWILQAAFLVAGESLEVARLTMVCLSTLGLVALSVLVNQLWGRWAGLATAGMVVALAEIPVRAGAVMSDLPAMTFAVVAFGAGVKYRNTGRQIWILLSAAAFAGAVLIHPLLLYTVVPLGVILFLPGLEGEGGIRRVRWTDLAAFVGLGVALGLIVLLLIDWQNFLTWVVGYNVATVDPDVQLAPSTSNWHLVTEYLAQNWVVAILSLPAIGVLALKRRARPGLIVVLTWLFVTGAMLLLWSPVWRHYLLFLILPMTALIGGAFVQGGEWMLAAARGEGRLHWWQVVLSFLMVFGLLTFGVRRASQTLPQPEGGPDWSAEQMAARSYIETMVEPGEFVAADDPLLTFAAGRLVLPTMTGASFKRIRSGYLTSGDLIDSVLRYEAPVVLFATGRLALLPTFEGWVASLAMDRRDFGSMWAYRLDYPIEPSHSFSSTLGTAIALNGYDLSSEAVRAGDVLTLTLFWRQINPIDRDYTVFIHLVDPAGQTVTQGDGMPLAGAYPTSHWEEGPLLPDRYVFSIPAGVSPERLRLFVGMYHRPSMERMRAVRPDGTRWPDDRILLTDLDFIGAELQTP